MLDEKELYLNILQHQVGMVCKSNIGKFQRLFGMSNFLVVDNNKSDLELTTLIMNRVSKEVRKLIKGVITSYIAKRWMVQKSKKNDKVEVNR